MGSLEQSADRYPIKARRLFDLSRPICWISIFAVTVMIRALHIMQWPVMTYGMNVTSAVRAKEFLHGDLAALTTMPPVAPLVYAACSWATQTPPGRLLPWVMVAHSALQVAALLIWLNSMRLPRRIKLGAIAVAMFLPFFNGYGGERSLQTSLGSDFFMIFAGLVNYFLRSKSWTFVILAMGCAFSLPWIRTEYCVLLVWHLLFTSFSDFKRFVDPQRLPGFLAIVLALMAGSIAVMGFRYAIVGQFALTDGIYSCWTFLDGMPAAWLNRDLEFAALKNPGERDRVIVGMKYFGDPAGEDYSLAAMIRRHPGQTFMKGVLNLPRWFEELFGRDQVVPRPASLFALTGFLYLLRSRRTRSSVICGPIVATVPLVFLMLYAEYLQPAYFAICLLISIGAAGISTIASRFLSKGLFRHSQLLLIICICAGMEYLYFRSGANLPGRIDFTVSGPAIDHALSRIQGGRVVLDPYSLEIDASTSHNFSNEALNVMYRQKFGGAFKDLPLSVKEMSSKIEGAPLDMVVCWRVAQKPEEIESLGESWLESGFESISEERQTLLTGTVLQLRILKRRITAVE